MPVINDTKTRLLIITPTLQCGGSEKMVSILCNNIDTQKFTVCLAVVDNTQPFYKIVNSNIKIVDLKKKRVLFSLFAIKNLVQEFRPQLLFSTANHLNLYLAIFRKSFGPSITFIAREASIVSITSKQAKMPAIYNWLIKKYYHRFDHIICQSAYMQQDLVGHYHISKEKTSVIYNAVVETKYQPKSLSTDLTNKPYKLVTVARLSSEKGIERLIHAVGLVSVPVNYFIIGNGKKSVSLQKLVNELHLQDQIFLSEEKPDPFSGMQDADLFLLGSYYEGFPNVLLEAGSYGIPVIAFNAPGGIAEVIRNGENGFLVDDNDILGFATAIHMALNINWNRQAIMEDTATRFSIKRMMNELEKLFLLHAENK